MNNSIQQQPHKTCDKVYSNVDIVKTGAMLLIRSSDDDSDALTLQVL